MRRVLARLCDGGRVLRAAAADAAARLICCLARIDGWAVGIVAYQADVQQAGVLDPDACDKAIRAHACCATPSTCRSCSSRTCPASWSASRSSTPRSSQGDALAAGPAPGHDAEADGVLRKAFGLAWQALAGNEHGADRVYAWPGAEIGFMDPEVGVNVAYGTKLGPSPTRRSARRSGAGW